jgi:molybdate transport system substrate-binding protein
MKTLEARQPGDRITGHARHRLCVRIAALSAGLLGLVWTGSAAIADTAEIRVAVASNFTDAARELQTAFEQGSDTDVVLSFGSTGKHYAQIVNGAPFHLFLAADAERPERLESEGHAAAGSRFTYAIGKLVLWSPNAEMVDANGDVLSSDAFRFLSMANPRLAPYGKAAEQVLRGRGLWASLQGRIVRGGNISQAFRFVSSGNADLGFIALSQVMRPGQDPGGSMWRPPQASYSPIEQQAVLLVDRPPARAFMKFLRSDRAHEIIRGFGYETPP